MLNHLTLANNPADINGLPSINNNATKLNVSAPLVTGVLIGSLCGVAIGAILTLLGHFFLTLVGKAFAKIFGRGGKQGVDPRWLLQ